MVVLLLLPAIVSLLVLAAHWFRAAGVLAAVPVLGLFPLLLIPRGWVARLFQFVLCLEALEWVRTAVAVAFEREAQGEPWARMAAILGAVAALCLAAVVCFESDTLRRVYPRRSLL
jgi:hypothetical protein